MLTIHAFPPSPRSFKVLLVANHLGLDYEFALCDLMRGDQRSDAFIAVNPNAKAPALEHNDFKLWESNAIITYLASLRPEQGLMPKDASAQAQVLSWLFWDTSTWDPAAAILAYERFVKAMSGLGGPDPAEVQRGEDKVCAAAAILDQQLERRRFICGETLTLADLAVSATLTVAAPAQLPLDGFGAIARWQTEIMALPAWGRTCAMQAPPVAA
jgi:glutathione S-transferase